MSSLDTVQRRPVGRPRTMQTTQQTNQIAQQKPIGRPAKTRTSGNLSLTIKCQRNTNSTVRSEKTIAMPVLSESIKKRSASTDIDNTSSKRQRIDVGNETPSSSVKNSLGLVGSDLQKLCDSLSLIGSTLPDPNLQRLCNLLDMVPSHLPFNPRSEFDPWDIHSALYQLPSELFFDQPDNFVLD